MMNFIIGIAPILLALLFIIVVLVRSIAKVNGGYKVFILPAVVSVLTLSWLHYWII